MLGLDFGAWVVPAITGVLGSIVTLFVAWLTYSGKRQETLEAASERLTLAQLVRMESDIEALRTRVTECETEIRRCEHTIREMQTRGHRWYRWAHELMGHVLEARARATPPKEGWANLPEMPNKFDLDDVGPPRPI